MDLKIYKIVRNKLESGSSIREVYIHLKNLNYSEREIGKAIQEYEKDEQHDFDNKLIKDIQKRLKKGEALLKIVKNLEENGVPSLEVRKALTRVKTTNDDSLSSIFKKWELYSILQISALVLSALFTFFLDFTFFITFFFILIMMVTASSRINEDNKKWMPEIYWLPGMRGVGITRGLFGYNPIIGNYFCFWKANPALITTIVLISFGLIMTAARENIFIFIGSVLLAFFSIIGFLLQPVKSDEDYLRSVGNK